MNLREVQHQQDIVNRILDAGQMVYPDIRPGDNIWTILCDQEGNAHAIAQVLVAANRRNVGRLVPHALKTIQQNNS